MLLAHQIELDPTVKQIQEFVKACGVARFAWNWALAEWHRQVAAGEKPAALNLKKQWNALKGEQFAWVYESPKDANQMPFTYLGKAWGNYFRDRQKGEGKRAVRKPKFKRKGVHDAFYVSNDKFVVQANHVRLPLIGAVRIKEPLRFSGQIMGATIRRDADRWLLSIQVDVGVMHKPRHAEGTTGIDLGINALATLSNGEAILGPKPLARAHKRLRRRQRKLSRKKKGSRNRAKAARRLAKCHRRVRRVRADFLHKLTTRLCRENQAVVMEDLCVSGMLRNHRLARAISDMGFFEFRRQMTYKAKLFETRLVVAGRFFASSKMCSHCGHKREELKLCERTFACNTCGLLLNRDINAARNLLNLLGTVGYTGSQACGPTRSTVMATSLQRVG